MFSKPADFPKPAGFWCNSRKAFLTPIFHFARNLLVLEYLADRFLAHFSIFKVQQLLEMIIPEKKWNSFSASQARMLHVIHVYCRDNFAFYALLYESFNITYVHTKENETLTLKIKIIWRHTQTRDASCKTRGIIMDLIREI